MTRKAKILKIGNFDEKGNAIGWTFDCLGGIPCIELEEKGKVLYAGYSIEELRQLANRRLN